MIKYKSKNLHRLVEIYFHLGVEKEAKKYAKILGITIILEWFKQSYKILNKDYESLRQKKLKEMTVCLKIIKKNQYLDEK